MPGTRAHEAPLDAAARRGDVPDLAATMRGIAAAARNALGADRATCYAYEVESQIVSAVYTTESDPVRKAFLERTVGLSPAQLPIWRLQLAQPDPLLAIEDLALDPVASPGLTARLGTGALIGVRLEHFSVRNHGSPALLGTLFCSYARPRGFSAAERQAARGLANLAALTLANARMQIQAASSLAVASAASDAMHRERDYSAALVASMQDGLTVLSPEGIVTEVSPSFCRMTGFSRDELIGRGCPYPHWPDARPEALERGFRLLRETTAAEWDLEFQRKDGERFPVILAGSLLRGHDGEVVGYVGTVKDITERQRADQELRRSATANQALAAEQAALRRVATQVAAEAAPEEIFAQVAEEAAGLADMRAAVVVRFTPDGATVVGSHGDHLAVGQQIPTMGEGVLAAVARTGRPATIDYTALEPGSLRTEALAFGIRESVAAPVAVAGRLWGAVLATTKRDGGLPADAQERLGRFAELVALAIANTEARARLAAQAASDPLTGLANHRVFFERLHGDVERARRHARPLSLVVIDLDHFKRINDTHGHPVGDRALVEVAERLTALVRPEDTLARIGGEEFAWLLPESDARAAWSAAERARQVIAAAVFPEIGSMTMSAGVAQLATGGSVNELFRAADAALYWAKAQGRNVCVPYTPEHERAMSARPAGAPPPLTPSVERLLALAREGLGMEVAAVGELDGDTQVWRHLDGDGEAFGVHRGGAMPVDEAYRLRVAAGRLPSLIRDARHDERMRDLPFAAAEGIGAYAGVPITLPGGELYGMLCCLSSRAEPVLGERDVRLLRMVAAMLGEELDRGERLTRARHRRETIMRALES